MLNDQENYQQNISEPYELLISKEDYRHQIPLALTEIADFVNKDIVDLGAGTGRFSCMFAPVAHHVTATDFAADMLRVTAGKLAAKGLSNWNIAVADSRNLPVPDASVDIVISGWSLCYLASSNDPAWRGNLRQVINEIKRIVRPGGMIIIIETLGTGNEEPVRHDDLKAYYQALEEEYGFQHRALRTDYRFDSVEQAESLCRDFFGDELGDRIRRERLTIVAENTGLWWKTND